MNHMLIKMRRDLGGRNREMLEPWFVVADCLSIQSKISTGSDKTSGIL
jgi:hypothetical protein